MKNENKVSFVEEVFLEELGQSYVYTFSNDPVDIKNAIEKETGYVIPVNDTEWRVNPHLSKNIQKVMVEENVAFCTTNFIENDKHLIYINRRCGNSFSIIVLEIDITPLEKIVSAAFGKIAAKHLKDANYSQAIITSTQALKLAPYVGTFALRAWAYYNKGEFDLALADYSRAISIDPKAAKLYVLRARVFDAKKQKEQTLHDLLQAFELDPDETGKYLFKEMGINDYDQEVIQELMRSLREQAKN